MEIEELKQWLLQSWDFKTCSPGLKDSWNKENPSLGQCAITALIVNDFFGGKIMRCMTSTGSHYYNLINDKIIDLTCEQFLGEIPDYEHSEERSVSYLLSNDDTRNRYEMLITNLSKVYLDHIKKYKLIDANGEEYYSSTPGVLGGNKKLKIYGRLDCPSANSWLKKGFYKRNRVFFANEEDAISAGYRPCAVCMKEEYLNWKQGQMVKKLIK